MSLIVKRKAESTIPILEPGLYFANCVAIIDIGHQYSEIYKKSQPKVIIIFEIPSERVLVDGVSKPRWISDSYTMSLSSKAKLSSILESWTGKEIVANEFCLADQLGKPASVQVINKEGRDGQVRAYLTTIAGLPKGVEPPKLESETLLFDVDAPNEDVFAKLPEWIKNKIRASDEYKAKVAGEATLDIDPDTGEVVEEVPF